MSMRDYFKTMTDMFALGLESDEDERYQRLETAGSDLPSSDKDIVAAISLPTRQPFLEARPREPMAKTAFADASESCIETSAFKAGHDRLTRYAKFYNPRHMPFASE